MAAISIPYQDPWIVARWAFRDLLGRTALELPIDDDKRVLEQAEALDGLHFGLLDVDQGRRIAEAMTAAAHGRRLELLDCKQPEARDLEYAEALAVLGMQLLDVLE